MASTLYNPQYDDSIVREMMKEFNKAQEIADIGSPTIHPQHAPPTNPRKVISPVSNEIFNEEETKKIKKVRETIHTGPATVLRGAFNVNPQIVIAGGCFAIWLRNIYARPNDIDTYFLDVDDADSIQEQIFGVFGEHNFDVSEKANYVNPNILRVITWKGENGKWPFQFILTKYKTRQDLIESFDFKHCCTSFDLTLGKLYITRKTYDAIANRELVVNRMAAVNGLRVKKYMNDGWFTNDDKVRSLWESVKNPCIEIDLEIINPNVGAITFANVDIAEPILENLDPTEILIQKLAEYSKKNVNANIAQKATENYLKKQADEWWLTFPDTI